MRRFTFFPGGRSKIERDPNSANDSVSDDTPVIANGAREIAMTTGARYRTEVGALTVTARLVPTARKLPASAQRDRRFLATGFCALAAVAALVGFVKLSATDDGALTADNNEDRLAALSDFVQRVQDREQQPTAQTATGQGAAAPVAAAASGEMGRAGRRDAAQPNGRLRVARNELPTVGARTARDQVATRGIFISLHAAEVAGGGAMGNPWNQLGSGDADESTMGTGGPSGDGWGYGGLSTVGTGIGGGGHNDAIVIGSINTRTGTCTGDGPCDPFGTGHSGHLAGRDDHSRFPRTGTPTIEGTIAPEAIRRVVRRNLGQISHCQEQGFAADSRLAGRVVVRFVIGSGGTVMGANFTESNVSVASVNTCIANAVHRWTFDVPGDFDGTAVVSYPFVLSPAE
jgi:hypothetical protein